MKLILILLGVGGLAVFALCEIMGVTSVGLGVAHFLCYTKAGDIFGFALVGMFGMSLLYTLFCGRPTK